jgi:hypothetical protein
MSRRRPKRGSGQELYGGRSRHKKATSPEARAWEDGHLIPKPPPWMDTETYRRLAELRRDL